MVSEVKQSLKLKRDDVKKMEAKISMTGSSNSLTQADSSLRLESTPSAKATQAKMAAHVKAKIKKALQFETQAMPEKNMLFGTLTPCQNTKAGACQKRLEKGMYKMSASHIACWKSLFMMSSLVRVLPTK